MGLAILYGRAGSGKTRECLEEIAGQLRRGEQRSSLFLLAPNAAVQDLEERLLLEQELSGFMRLQVFGFQRFGEFLCQALGCEASRKLAGNGKKRVLQQLAAKHREYLTVLKQPSQGSRFIDTFSQNISEFKKYRMSAAAVWQASEGASDGLAGKLRDIALVYEAYEKELAARGYQDNEDVLTAAAQQAAAGRSELLQNACVWVDGFQRFTKQELYLLEVLLRQGAAVTVTLTAEALPEGQGLQKEPVGLFSRAQQTMAELKTLAARLGIECSTNALPAARRFPAKSAIACVEEAMAKGDFAVKGVPGDGTVALREAGSRLAEVEGVASDLLCRYWLSPQETLRLDEVAVVMSHAAYAPILAKTFAALDIPYHLAYAEPYAYHPLLSCLKSLQCLLKGDWSRDAVFSGIKSGLLCPEIGTQEEWDELENYVLQDGLEGPEEWAVSWKSCPQDKLRQALWEKLDGLDAKGEFATAAACVSWVQELLAGGLKEQAGQSESMWQHFEQLCRDYAVLSDVGGGSLAECLAFLVEALGRVSKPVSPRQAGCVRLQTIEQCIAGQYKALYFVGANEELIPGGIGGEDFINDQERQELAGLSISIGPSRREKVLQAQFEVYQTLAQGIRFLWLSYALADEEGKGQLPAAMVKRMREMLPDNAFARLPDVMDYGQLSDDEIMNQVVHTKQVVAHLGSVLQSYRTGSKVQDVWLAEYFRLKRAGEISTGKLAAIEKALHAWYQPQKLTPELADRIFAPEGKLKGSVTAFEAYNECPFQYFVKHGLQLAERETTDLDARDKGNFLHAVMEKAAKPLWELANKKKRDTMPEDDEGEIQKVIEKAIQAAVEKRDSLRFTRNIRNQRHLERLQRTARVSARRLAEFYASSQFELDAVEKQMKFPLQLDKKELCFAGKIDRIDTWKKEDGEAVYAAVVDYKASNSKKKLSEEKVYYGLQLQLLTYLLYLQKQKYLPAAALYVPLVNSLKHKKSAELPRKSKIKSSDDADPKMSGWMLEDEAVVMAFDPVGEFSPVKYNKPDRKTQIREISKNSKASAKTKEVLENVLGHVENVLRQTGQAILNGGIASVPREYAGESPCTYCHFQSLCRFDAATGYAPELLDNVDKKDLFGQEENCGEK